MGKASTRTGGKLLDCTGIVREYGVSRSVASAWMRQLPKVVRPAGVRKIYVRRDDVEAMLERATMQPLIREGRGARQFEVLDVVETLEDGGRYAGLLKLEPTTHAA